jgi:hypothetical protein
MINLGYAAGGRGSGGGDLGATRLTWTRKREGTAARRGSTGRREGVESVAMQGPRDTAKATLLEAQTPAMKGTSPDTTPDVGATGIGRFRFSVSTLPAGGRQATRLFKGTDGPPTSRSIRPAHRGIRDGLRGASPMVTECPYWSPGSRPARGDGKAVHRAKGHRCQQIDGNGRVTRDAKSPKPYWRSFVTLESRVQLL